MNIDKYLGSLTLIIVTIALIICIEFLYDYFKNVYKNRIVSFALRVTEIIVTILGLLSLITILKG